MWRPLQPLEPVFKSLNNRYLRLVTVVPLVASKAGLGILEAVLIVSGKRVGRFRETFAGKTPAC